MTDREIVETLGLAADEDAVRKMAEYNAMVIAMSRKMNLTGIKDAEESLVKNIYDSLTVYEEKYFPKNGRMLDLGTGAGFPGLVLAVAFPEKDFLLVDSVRKKISFIDEAAENLGLTNVKTSYERAEDLVTKSRSSFDLGLCRGVANLRIILEYMIPFLKVNGRFLPQKLNENELSESENALKTLNSKILKIHKFRLPESNDERIIIEIQKLKEISSRYPRKTGIPAKKPL